jgi:DNA replication protein DnaC
MNEIEIMNACARELKLASFKENAELYAQNAVREQWGYIGYLRRLLEEEVTRRRDKSKITRIHKAGFPQMKYLEELERNELPIEGQAILPILETLDFIKEGRSAVMYGNPKQKKHILLSESA